MKKETKKQKFKIAGLIALLAGGLAAGGIAYNKTATVPEDETVKKTETTLSDLSVETIETRIEFLTDQIRLFNKQLETKGLNPEERFEIRQAITFSKNEIHKFQQELKQRQDKTKKTVFFDTVRDSR